MGMIVNSDERRIEIINIIRKSATPVSGTDLAKMLNVSRQVIVQDIALLRATHHEILSTNKGYMLTDKPMMAQRVFKVNHDDEHTEDELMTIVDFGGKVLDIFVEHKLYGKFTAPLSLNSRRDVSIFIANIKNGQATLLKNITKGDHYHTVEADSEEILDEIEQALTQKGYIR
jgi:transcriptional regulator of NAD metabolism